MRGLGSDNVDTRLRQSDFSGDVAAPWLGMSVAQFAELDRMLRDRLVRPQGPAAAVAASAPGDEAGALLSVLNASDNDLLMPVANKLIAPPSQWQASLDAIAAAVG